MEAGDVSAFWRAVPKLEQLNARQAEAAAAAQTAKAALASEGAALDALKSKATSAADSEKKMASTLDGLKDASKTAKGMEALAGGTGKVNEIGEAFGRLGGPIGHAGQKIFGLADGFKKLSASLGSAGPYVAIVAVLALITIGAIAATVAIAKMAVTMADANRNTALATAGLAASSDSLKGLGDALPKVQRATGLAADEIQKLADQLDTAGVSAKDLPDALMAIAMAKAGGASSAYLQKLNADLKSGQKSAAELAQQVNRDFGGIVQKKLLSLDEQSKRLHSNFGDLFGGLKIEGLLAGFAKLVGLFDASSATGKTLKFIFESIFQPLIDGATAAIPTIERALITATIWALKAYVALKPYAGAIKLVIEVFAVLAALVVGGVVASIGLFIAFLGGAVAIIVGVIAVIVELVSLLIDGLGAAWDYVSAGASSAWEAIKGAVQGAIDWISGIDLGSMAVSLIEGFVNGILGAGGAVLSAITGVVGGAIDAAKSLLGIHSPSTVFEHIGAMTGAGAEKGIDKSSAGVQSALEGMVDPSTAQGGASAGKGGGGGPSIVIQNMTVQGSNGEELAQDFLSQLTRALEGDSLQLGGGEAPAM
jgi:hypothetical protein